MNSAQDSPLSTEDAIVKVVHDAYSDKARTGADLSYTFSVAKSFGYTLEQLHSIPAESHLGLSCGNPVAAASIKDGEVVLDLGSGGGIDILLAASKVGPRGQAIGLDMSEDMIALARRNAARKNLRPPQVAFVQTLLTKPLPIASESVDCVMSNCVINLLPNAGKAALLKEVHRVLKPGGRVVLDDIIAKKPLPDALRSDLVLYIGCISGAVQLGEYKDIITDAGFSDAVFVDTHGDLNVYTQSGSPGCCPPTVASTNCCSTPAPSASKCCSPAPGKSNDSVAKLADVNEWAASYQIYAIKSGEKMVTAAADAPSPLLNWWDAYPKPKSSPPNLTCGQVAALLRDPEEVDYAVVDVRRNDHAGGHVRGSFQHAAQTFYDELANLHKTFGLKKQVIFYCNSSNGRGPRCAAWYQDFLDEHGYTQSRAYVMQGGAKAWLDKFGEAEDLVDRD
ncbi:hypothetical protein SERLA73DRAFT_158418 [Serpula lacrymans var. lacrymans S7.3]|uniref:Arsenite methyltransferase n=2 Tax=Serpula lacrymans var. lacrymans TaxID=341189 RepID=F8PIU1_SERL3|nr:uncharacterized protein SERLADRAFT_433897 [Serpula lacrymans var. lacrymans S7.9]EGO04041.1 hypothetical protein SERLA73DRAFT_158418 [Serpula lacrymans var. lacrymans S7.3]EGO29958.1 hypothetical protein SERLADRAFT_433897 [Serpula lacrymans var. lacrymans S7.9]